MTAEQPKRRGRPPGSTLPPERHKGVILRARVTAKQAAEWERRGAAEWLRRSLDRG